MKIAILRESKRDAQSRIVENRVVMPPDVVEKLISALPHTRVFVEAHAGQKIGHTDKEYEAVGAKMVSHTQAFKADLVLGVKETQYTDFHNIHKNNIVISFQHFAASGYRTKKAKSTKATYICLETIQIDNKFPCLAPMSEAAAKVVARHADMFALINQKTIASGLSFKESKRLKVTILGAGTVGKTAAREFSARGLEVHLLDRPNIGKLKKSIEGSFFVVSAMYCAGACPEKLVTKELLNKMIPGGCAYPVDIDQGGGIEGVKETSILDPFKLPKIKGTNIYHFAPPNLPSLGAQNASEALGHVILPYVIEIVKKGIEKAARENPAIKNGINIQNGEIVHPGLASVFN
ncbi:hypothetical protein ACFL52_02840 [Candidatus Margulisiibacteriota bacterium]